MMWFFERDQQHLRCELRREMDGRGYELVVTEPDGTERTERFAEAGECVERLLALQAELIEQGWRSPSPPV